MVMQTTVGRITEEIGDEEIMERGVKMLTRIIAVAFAVGGLVVVLHPDYRNSAKALWRGEPETSAIWWSNLDYYTEVTIDEVSDQ